MKINIIVAMDPNRCIGANGKIPWICQEDLTHFRNTTLFHPIIMGRKTFESFKYGPLDKRHNLVLSSRRFWELSNPYLSHVGAHANLDVCSSLLEAFAKCYHRHELEVFVIGGAQVYEAALPYTDKIYVTRITQCVENGDTFFPIDLGMRTGWVRDSSVKMEWGSGKFETYVRAEGNEVRPYIHC